MWGKEMNRKNVLLLMLTVVLTVMITACAPKEEEPSEVIAVAWSDSMESYSYVSTIRTIEAAGATPVVLDQALSADLNYDENGNLVGATDEHGILTSESARKVKENTWQNSNVPELMEDVDRIVFPGGKDISPTLYYCEQGWHGVEGDTDYSAERDVSDYLLMSYCLEQDVPCLGICRGMQMMSVVSGADMIQDLPAWYGEQGVVPEYDHRDPEKEKFVSHPVDVLTHDSLLYQVMGADTISGVPSWHHQAVGNVDNTRLLVTAQAVTGGKPIIEAVERPDKKFCLGLQFHPEVAVRKHLDKEADADSFMDYDKAMEVFKALLEAGKGVDHE